MPLRRVKQLEARHLLGTYARYDVLVERGSGPYLIDRRNKRYLDLLAGIGVNALGYSHPRMLRVLRKQIKRPLHISNLLYHEYQGRLAERLARITGLDRAFFTNSGTESVEGCLKLARLYANRDEPVPRRHRILALEGSFHGRTFGSLSATWEPRYREPFAPLVPGFEFVRFDDPEDLEARFDSNVAAVILEAVQGEGGIRPVSEAFYRRARSLTRAHGAALIADEVQCGLGRTGRWLGVHRFAGPGERDALPDLVSIAKPLGGGLPLGAVLMKEEVAECLGPGLHGSTFGGGPLACRLSLEMLKIIEDDGLLDHVRAVGDRLRGQLEALRPLPGVEEIRGDGLMIGISMAEPCRGLVDRLLERGFIANCTKATVLRLLPPLIIQPKQLDKFIGALRSLLEAPPSKPEGGP
jgi:acetylornithine aminotransferase/acetylornithine/N-succinyldiaminopimelate aminotransferase